MPGDRSEDMSDATGGMAGRKVRNADVCALRCAGVFWR